MAQQTDVGQRRSMNNSGRRMNQNQSQNQQGPNQGRRMERESGNESHFVQNLAIGGLRSLALKVWEECRPGFEKARTEALAGFERGIGEMRQGVERAWSEVVHACEGVKDRFLSPQGQKSGSTIQ